MEYEKLADKGTLTLFGVLKGKEPDVVDIEVHPQTGILKYTTSSGAVEYFSGDWYLKNISSK